MIWAILAGFVVWCWWMDRRIQYARGVCAGLVEARQMIYGHASDRDAALRKAAGFEAVGQQPGPCADTASPKDQPND